MGGACHAAWHQPIVGRPAPRHALKEGGQLLAFLGLARAAPSACGDPPCTTLVITFRPGWTPGQVFTRRSWGRGSPPLDCLNSDSSASATFDRAPGATRRRGVRLGHAGRPRRGGAVPASIAGVRDHHLLRHCGPAHPGCRPDGSGRTRSACAARPHAKCAGGSQCVPPTLQVACKRPCWPPPRVGGRNGSARWWPMRHVSSGCARASGEPAWSTGAKASTPPTFVKGCPAPHHPAG